MRAKLLASFLLVIVAMVLMPAKMTKVGAAGKEMMLAFGRAGAELTPLHFTPDGDFPLGDPNPVKQDVIEEGLQTLESDDFLFGGYGKHSRELQEFVSQIARDTGILLDTTYSGKAFFGMVETIKEQKLTGNILFWHTGGIFNLMA